MKYVDMHCDTLTESLKKGLNLKECGLQTDLEKLKKSGCAAQCFAIFTEGGGAAAFFDATVNYYRNMLDLNAKETLFVRCADELLQCINGEKTGCILTVENLGFLNGDISGIARLAGHGVKMASLVWNSENAFAYPNLIFENGLPAFEKREMRGLKRAGAEAVEELDKHKIIIDISHLSDGGAEEILSGRKIPIVASHSNAESICGVSRNLTDGLIKKIADCGGVIGINFCKDFLGAGDNYEIVYRHVNHIKNVGGEDVLAWGSDFDGIPAAEGLEDCTRMPKLFERLLSLGLSASVLEKLCYKNFVRVFKDVCG